MKKNNRGFVLVETLIVTVFLMTLVGLIYSYYIPLVAEFEKKEVYDDIDSKYAMYWIKLMVEDGTYTISNNNSKQNTFVNNGYVMFNCNELSDAGKANVCAKLVNSLEVEGCNSSGVGCLIFVTKYKLGKLNNSTNNCFFKNYINNLTNFNTSPFNTNDKKLVFSEFRNYINTLPYFTTPSLTDSKYRVIAVFHHKKDNNDYYSYGTMEVFK